MYAHKIWGNHYRHYRVLFQYLRTSIFIRPFNLYSHNYVDLVLIWIRFNSTWLSKNNTNVQNEISINWLSAFIWSLLTRDLLSYSCVCLSTTNVYFHVCCVIIIIHNYSVAFFQNNWYKEINISLESRIGQYSI